ncbi:MAG: hypothetical protein ACREQI_07320 [Candidatus Binataceae bacterium]
MPAKKRKPAKSKGAMNAAADRVSALRKTVMDLRKRLEREVRVRKIEARLRAGAKQAQKQLDAQVKTLRTQGRKVAEELKAVVGRSRNLEGARHEAEKLVARLRKDLAQRTADLRRKSDELRKLAGESARRAAEIIRGEEHEHHHHHAEATHEPAPPPGGGGEPDSEF